MGRGDPAALARAVERMLGRVGLARFGDQPCGGYSGGMKRKLSFGVALMGNPAVVTRARAHTRTHIAHTHARTHTHTHSTHTHTQTRTRVLVLIDCLNDLFLRVSVVFFDILISCILVKS